MAHCQTKLSFTKSENRIRIAWLILSTILPTLYLFYYMLLIINYGLLLADSITIFIWFLGQFFCFLPIFINYYCTYKNPGRNLIVVIMSWAGIGVFSIVFNSEITSVWMASVFLIKISLFYCGYKLFILNTQIQEKLRQASPTYRAILAVFSSANNLEELNISYTELRNSSEFGKELLFLSKAYLYQKKKLNQENPNSIKNKLKIRKGFVEKIK